MPALFPDEEKEAVLSQVGQEALRQGMGPAKESVWQYFVNKSANNLHVVLGMSPVGDTLRTRCRNFPGALARGLGPGRGHVLRCQGAPLCAPECRQALVLPSGGR